MQTIYEPKGKAREYSPLALNIYFGCDHGCNYCYAEKMFNRWGNSFKEPREKQGFIEALKKDAKNWKKAKEQVLLCFTGDPYCLTNDRLKLTRQVLTILLENQFPVAILTKGGMRCLQDLDLFKEFGEHIKIGATFTFRNSWESERHEPGATLPISRGEALKRLSDYGIKTWASFEPVIYPADTLYMIGQLLHIVDEYKIGKLNHVANTTDWKKFLYEAVKICREFDKKFYIKKDLAAFAERGFLTEQETDQDYLTLKPWE